MTVESGPHLGAVLLPWETFRDRYSRGRGATGIEWVQTRGAGLCPMMHRTALHNTGLPSPQGQQR